MNSKVQSPEIGTALRTALSLDAAGGMPMDFDQTIVPVAVVSDVRELLTSKYIPVFQGSEQAGVAGEYSYCALSWDSGATPTARRIICDSILISSTSVSTMYLGFKTGGMAGTALGLPRRKVASLSASSVTGRCVGTTSLDFPTTFIDRHAGVYVAPANVPFRIQFAEPIILDQQNQALVVGIGTANLSLRVLFEWREERA